VVLPRLLGRWRADRARTPSRRLLLFFSHETHSSRVARNLHAARRKRTRGLRGCQGVVPMLLCCVSRWRAIVQRLFVFSVASRRRRTPFWPAPAPRSSLFLSRRARVPTWEQAGRNQRSSLSQVRRKACLARTRGHTQPPKQNPCATCPRPPRAPQTRAACP
jgi:hypothetical protein